MSKETTKSLPLRVYHLTHYLTGKGLDIGAGDDPLPGAIPWDWEHGGDANTMAGAPNNLDYIYSSHCLEHMHNVENALRVWTSLLKTGGHLFVIVPDWVLYEKRMWPSKFNGDHKHTFSLTEKVDRPNHFHISRIKSIFETIGLEMIEYRLEDRNYDYSLPDSVDQTTGRALAQLFFLGKKI